jgi:hypothetical protein
LAPFVVGTSSIRRHELDELQPTSVDLSADRDDAAARGRDRSVAVDHGRDAQRLNVQAVASVHHRLHLWEEVCSHERCGHAAAGEGPVCDGGFDRAEGVERH